MKSSGISTLILVLIFLIPEFTLYAQRSVLNYKVMQGGNNIGMVRLQKTDSLNTTRIILNSLIQKRFIIQFKVTEKQESFYQNGLLMQSYIYRCVNKDVKSDKHILYTGTHYEVQKDKITSPLKISRIDYNFMNLYFNEPVNKKQVYSDNFEQMLNIEKIGNETYKVKLPDGNSTTYYYNSGLCTKVKVEQSLFTVEFVLQNK